MEEIIVLNQHGDDVISWDPDKPKQVEKAKKQFDELAAAGYKFFRAKSVEVKGKEIKRFSPRMGKIIAAPVAAPAGAGGPLLSHT